MISNISIYLSDQEKNPFEEKKYLKIKIIPDGRGNNISSIIYKFSSESEEQKSREIPSDISQGISRCLKRDIFSDLIWTQSGHLSLSFCLGAISNQIDRESIEIITGRQSLYNNNKSQSNLENGFIYVFIVELSVYLVSIDLVLRGIINVPIFVENSKLDNRYLSSNNLMTMTDIYRVWLSNYDSFIVKLASICMNFCTTFNQIFESFSDDLEISSSKLLNASVISVLDKVNFLLSYNQTQIDSLAEKIGGIEEKLKMIENELVVSNTI